MLRAVFIVFLLAIAAVWIVPSWRASDRTLLLRVRQADEIREAIRSGARSLGEEVVRIATEEDEEPPAVAAAPPKSSPPEDLTLDDRARLDRLVEEKLASD